MSNFSSPLFEASFDGEFIQLGLVQSAPPDTHEGSAKSASLKKPTKLWTEAENEILLKIAPQYSFKNWSRIAQHLSIESGEPLKKAEQVSQHWRRTLCSCTRKWVKEEDAILIEEYRRVGNSWSQICHRLQGRTDMQVKFRFEAIRRHYGL